VEVFDRDQRFDPAIDSIVRVEAGRLRSKLREYYGEFGQDDPVVIELPKGTYAVAIQSGGVGAAPVNTGPGVTDRQMPLAKPVVAVLPFENISGEQDQEYFTNGIVEDLITELSRVSGLRVISRQSSFTFKGKSATVQQVCEELRADYVVEGSMRKVGARVRISVQLVDGRTGQGRWAERYDREMLDIFSVQDEVVQKITAALQINLSPSEESRFGRKGTDNLEAYDCVLRGVEYFRSFRKQDLLQARALFRHAIRLDPTYAEAYAALARVLVYEWIVGLSENRETALTEAVALSLRAVELDPGSARTHSTLGWTYLWLNDYDRAIAEGEAAIKLDQSSSIALEWMTMCRAWAGQTDEAMQLVERALRLNPMEPYYFARGLTYYVMGRHEEAIELLEKGARKSPSFLPARLYLASSYGLLGRESEGRTQVAEILRINPDYRLATGVDRRITETELGKRFSDSLRYLGLP
jgi:adenylate cyclase